MSGPKNWSGGLFGFVMLAALLLFVALSKLHSPENAPHGKAILSFDLQAAEQLYKGSQKTSTPQISDVKHGSVVRNTTVFLLAFTTFTTDIPNFRKTKYAGHEKTRDPPAILQIIA